MKTKLLLIVTVLSSLFFVQCKKTADNPPPPLPPPINQTYYVEYMIDVGGYFHSFTFQNDGKFNFVDNPNARMPIPYVGTYKITGTKLEANYSLNQVDTSYSVNAQFKDNFATLEGTVMLIHKNDKIHYADISLGLISFIYFRFGGDYFYQGGSKGGHINKINFSKDGKLQAEVQPLGAAAVETCTGTYQLINGMLKANFKSTSSMLSFSFENAVVIKDGGDNNATFEVPPNKLKITLSDGTIKYGFLKCLQIN